MNPKEIVGSLRTLASDPTNRGAIVRDQGCLPGLVIFLQDKDQDVVFTALEVVYFLSLHLGNRAAMAQEPGLLKIVKKLMVQGKLKEKKIAIAAYTNLQAYADKNDDAPATTSSSSVSNNENASVPTQSSTSSTVQPLGTSTKQAQQQNISNSNSSSSSQQSASTKAGGLSLFGDNVRTKTAHTYTFFVSGMTSEADKGKVEELLLKVKGVISFFFDLPEQKAVVRTVTTVEEIIEKLSAAGMKASTNKKDIPEIIDKQGGLSGINKENATPGYLEETDGGSANASSSSSSWWGSITIFGAESAEDRNARIAKDKQQQTGGWFGRLSKALYIS